MTYLMENAKFALQANPEFPLGPRLPLYRLVAKRDIGTDVKAGDLGGLVSGPLCVADTGECWAYPGALVYAGARLLDDATVGAGAQISGPVTMRERSKVRGSLSLLASIVLRGDEVLEARDALVVNMPLHRIGQFVGEGQTIFAMEFDIGENNTSSIMLPASRCHSGLAAHLSCRLPGDRLAFVRRGASLAYLLPTYVDAPIPFKEVQGMLENLEGF